MSGRYARTYSRKKHPPPPISQFDKLVSDPGKGTHPVAAKTAGHVGKWGTTSFTSLRCINGNYGRENTGLKRSWPDSSPPGNELASNIDNSANGAGAVTAPVKKKKFFKSRDEGSGVPSPVARSNSTDWLSSSATPELPPPKIKSPESNLSEGVPSLSCATKSQTLPNLKAKNNVICPSTNKPSGGIKLKIFKSRNSESSLEYSSTVELPSDDSRSSSNPSSICSSPRLEEDRSTLELPDKVPANGECAPKEPKISSLALLEKNNTKASTDDKAASCQSPNVALNNSYDSCFEFGVLVDQQTGLPIAPNTPQKASDHDSVDPQLPPLSPKTKNGDFNIKGVQPKNNNPPESEALSSTKCERVNTPPPPPKVINTSSKETTESLQESECDTNKENSEITLPSTEDNIDLFCTDFDEDEIVDRTHIDYSSSGFTETLSRTDTLELIDLWGSQNSQGSTSSSGLTRSAVTSQSEGEKITPNDAKLTTKRSIFKSRTKDEKSKKRATYTHKWHNHDDKEDSYKREALERQASAAASGKSSSDPFEFDSTPELKRVQTWPASNADYSFEESQNITSVKCPKEAKKFYTVIKNVKKTHQLQESGEFQEFNDDVEYFLDALKSCNSVSTRSLASLNLAQKCMVPAFRMHLRAHGIVTKFFRALSDAPSHSKLSESSAMVMFALSQDRLNMDLDRDSLELMLNLLDTEARPPSNNEENISSDASLADHNLRIRTFCKELKQKGHAKHLKLENIDAATLAMETLLSLTSKRAGEWFKEELRMLGGVDHLIRTVTSCVDHFESSIQSWNSSLIEKLTKAERCLKVLENITHQNESNQEYLLRKSEPAFGKTLMRLYQLCHIEIPLNPEKTEGQLTVTPPNPTLVKVLVTTLVTIMKVLINLTHNSRKEALGSKLLGCEEKIYTISLYCLLIMPDYLNHDTKFEIQVLACCLLLNLVENSTSNRERLMDMRSPISALDDEKDNIFGDVPAGGSAMQSLVSLFYTCEESAREQEAHTDHIIDNDLDQDSNKDEEKKDDDIEETVARLLQKAGRHMEDTLIAAYTSLLSGFCLMDNKEFEEKIRSMQPEGNFKKMVAVLKKFFHFMNLTATTALMRSLKPTERVLKYMEKIDKPPDPEKAKKDQKDDPDKDLVAFDAFGF